jgi:malate dehydrogenase (oxaloacetate-decarboxylating)
MPRLSKYFDIKRDRYGMPYMEVYVRGIELLRLTATNKGTAFTRKERQELSLDGLLPPRVTSLDQQIERIYQRYHRDENDIAKYRFLRELQDRSEVAFYALLQKHLEEMMPIVYTPTVGKAVQQYSILYQTPRGLTVTQEHAGRIRDIVRNYPWQDVRMIVATDSSAILGIGDQGHGGLAISIGKLALYTAGSGISPLHTMPVNLDVGTDRQELLDDPNYLGVHEKRLTGEAYFELLDEFVHAIADLWPRAVIQWEDFARNLAFEVLERYREELPCFNDDIQGTGAMALAGLLSACKLKNQDITEQCVVIAGAGAGGVGVACAIQKGMELAGLNSDEARENVLVLDAGGLVIDRDDIESYKHAIAQSKDIRTEWSIGDERPGLLECIQKSGATVLIGLSGKAGLFDQAVIEAMAQNCDRPVIFPLSNPTAHSEATPAEILELTGGGTMPSCSPVSDLPRYWVSAIKSAMK